MPPNGLHRTLTFGPPKTEKSRRTLDFPAFVRDVLIEEHRTVTESEALAGTRWHNNGLVFPSEIGTPLEERNVLRRFQNKCKQHGLPKLRIYDLRHTHASLLIDQGVHPKKISERLGHSSIKLTMDTYGHLFEGSDRDSAEKIDQLLRPGPAELPKSPEQDSEALETRLADTVADKIADKHQKPALRGPVSH